MNNSNNTMSREEIFDRIAKQIGKQPTSCSCEKCKQMCQRTPCLGTPQDILALIDAGYADKVCYTLWVAGIALGHISYPIPMIQIRSINNDKKDGCCIFFQDGKCELHDKGLKPTEGRLSQHEVSSKELQKEYNLSYQTAKEWMNEENMEVIQEIVDKLKVINPKNF